MPVEDAEDAAPGNEDPLAEVVLKFKNDLTGKNKEGKKIKVYRDDVTVVVQHSAFVELAIIECQTKWWCSYPGYQLKRAIW